MGFARVSTTVLPLTSAVAISARSITSLPPTGVAFTMKADASRVPACLIRSSKVMVRVRPSASISAGVVPRSIGATVSPSTLVTGLSVNPSTSLFPRSFNGLMVGLE